MGKRLNQKVADDIVVIDIGGLSKGGQRRLFKCELSISDVIVADPTIMNKHEIRKIAEQNILREIYGEVSHDLFNISKKIAQIGGFVSLEHGISLLDIVEEIRSIVVEKMT